VPKEFQTSFAAGRISPSLWGQVGSPAYERGARTLKNFVVRPDGLIMNRSGTQHVNGIPIPSGAEGRARLCAFVGTDPDDSWILAFTEGRTLVYREDPDDPRFGFDNVTSVFETPYVESDLPNLRFEQDGDELIVLCAGAEPYVFTRSDDNLLMSAMDFEPQAYPDHLGAVMLHTIEGDGILPGAAVIGPRQSLGLDPFGDEDAESQLAGDSSHPRREWSWAVTRIVRDAEGFLYETTPEYVLLYYVSMATVTDDDPTVPTEDDEFRPMPRTVAIYPDWPQRLLLDVNEDDYPAATNAQPQFGGPLPEDHSVVKSRIYRGRDGVYGYIGETTDTFFVDEGAEPQYNNPPPGGRNPFEVLDRSGDVTAVETPTVIAHFQGRRYFAATPERQASIWASAIGGRLMNFDEVPIPDPDDAFEFKLRSRRHQRIHALVPREHFLVALTSAGEWEITGSGDQEVIAPGSVSAREIGTHGCSATVPPLSLDEAILYISNGDVTPRAIVYGEGGRRHVDLSVLARDYFENHTVVDWAYAEEPHRVIWAVRDDGKLLSCTWVQEAGVLAWALHELAGDDAEVESVAVKREGVEDAVYLIVNRPDEDGEDKRYLERFAYRLDGGSVLDGVFLDRTVTYNGRTEADSDTEFVFNPVVEESPVADTFRAYYTGTAPWGTGGDFIGEVVHFYEPGGNGLARCLVEWYGSSAGKPYYSIRFLECDADDAVSTYAWLFTGAAYVATSSLPPMTVSYGQWAKGVRVVSGLGHLSGETVSAVIDGEVRHGLTVEGGSLALAEEQQWDSYACVVHVGLPYECDFESLDAVQEQGKQKVISKLWVEVERSRGGSVGATLDEYETSGETKLVDLLTRVVADEYGLVQPHHETHEVEVQDEWTTRGRVAIRQSEPYGFTVCKITREYVLGG
jgi:hypothetical protein